MRRTLLFGATALATACAGAPIPSPARTPEPAPPPPAPPAPDAPARAEWPEPLAGVMGGRGAPHAQPVALPADARGRPRWLAFVGSPEVALGAWRVTREPDGTTSAEPVERWPAAVRVAGVLVEGGAAYVILETLGALDQPAGLRGVWIEGAGRGTPFDASPLALAEASDADDLATRVRRGSPAGTAERNSVGLLAALRAAGGSPSTLARALSTEGADVGRIWQGMFVQRTGHLDGQGAGPSPAVDRALAVIRAALETQACGAEACETWSDGGHAIVRFASQGGRWAIRGVLEDAPLGGAPSRTNPREVPAVAEPTATTALLRARARQVVRVIGEAKLTDAGGSIGVGLTDLAPDAPVVAVTEGAASRVFVIDAASTLRGAADVRWDAAFADADGDGRTDVVLRLDGTRGGAPVAWTQVVLAPAASVQAQALAPDLASALAVLGAPDARAAAAAAAAIPTRGVAREDACRVLTTASTPAGFRRVAGEGARVLQFEQPAMPTWLPKVVPAARVAPDDVRGLGAHCAELVCLAARPYCAWAGGTDSQHLWFSWRDGQLVLLGAADYSGE